MRAFCFGNDLVYESPAETARSTVDLSHVCVCLRVCACLCVRVKNTKSAFICMCISSPFVASPPPRAQNPLHAAVV